MIIDILKSKGLEHTILDSFVTPKISLNEMDPTKITTYETFLKLWKVNNGKAKVAIRINY